MRYKIEIAQLVAFLIIQEMKVLLYGLFIVAWLARAFKYPAPLSVPKTLIQCRGGSCSSIRLSHSRSIYEEIASKPGQRVTINELVKDTGKSVKEIKTELVELSQLTGASATVDKSGEITFIFPPNFEAIAKRNSLSRRLSHYYEKHEKIIIKLVIGLFACASLIVFALVMMSAGSSQTQKKDDSEDRRRSSSRSSQTVYHSYRPMYSTHSHISGT